MEKFSNSSERPNYTLTLNGISKLFVEAKKPSVDITIEIGPAMQARRYGWNAKHVLAILTNFEYLLVYDTTNKPEDGEDARTSLYRKYYFEEYAEKFEEIAELISRDTIYSGKSSESRFSTEIDETFLKQINKWRLEIGNYLYKSDYKNVDILNDTVQEFINQIIFLRIREARKLPLYKKLYETYLSAEVKVYKKYQSAYKQYDKLVRDKEYMIERGILRLYFKPSRTEQGNLDIYSDIKQVKTSYNIFPYDKNGDFITKEIMERDYPHAWEYLLEYK